MPDLFNQVLFHYVDANGKECTQTLTTQDQTTGGVGTYATLATKLQACSDASLICIQFQKTLFVTGTMGSGPYKSVYDRAAIMSHIASSGNPMRWSIPAPKADIFETDTKTLKLTNTDVIALDGQIQALCGNSSGSAAGPISYGNRTKAAGGPP